MEELMTYGEALTHVKNGHLIARIGWNGKKMFVFMRPADSLPLKVLLEAKSIPVRVKQWYENESYNATSPNYLTPFSYVQSVFNIEVTAYLCLKAADNSIVNGWVPSQTDMLAEDWYVLS